MLWKVGGTNVLAFPLFSFVCRGDLGWERLGQTTLALRDMGSFDDSLETPMWGRVP